MPFEVQPVQFTDVPELSRVMMTAMYTNLHWRLFWGSLPLSAIIERNVHRLPYMLASSGQSKRYQKAIDTETGTIVGYIRWILPSDGSIAWPEAMAPVMDNEEFQTAQENYQAASEKGRVKGLNSEMVAASDPCYRAFCEVVGDEQFLEPDYVTTEVKCQGQGVGSMLLRQGLAQADAAGVKCVVMSMPAGVRLYEKHGFVGVKEIVLDDTKWGGDADYTVTFLVRQPEHRLTSIM